MRLTGACSATLADGMFWDTSPAAGSTFVDARLNASLYGDGVTAAEVLGGRVALPQEFLPLYQAIDALAAEAQVRGRSNLQRQWAGLGVDQGGGQPLQLAHGTRLSNRARHSPAATRPVAASLLPCADHSAHPVQVLPRAPAVAAAAAAAAAPGWPSGAPTVQRLRQQCRQRRPRALPAAAHQVWKGLALWCSAA